MVITNVNVNYITSFCNWVQSFFSSSVLYTPKSKSFYLTPIII